MNYNISKLADINPDLTSELRDKCYKVVGLCQQVHKEMAERLLFLSSITICKQTQDYAGAPQ